MRWWAVFPTKRKIRVTRVFQVKMNIRGHDYGMENQGLVKERSTGKLCSQTHLRPTSGGDVSKE